MMKDAAGKNQVGAPLSIYLLNQRSVVKAAFE
jgi:hypothetical protein